MATELSKKSDPEAFFYLGLMHDLGKGAPETEELALKYYSRAAELGDSFAMRNLGEISYQKKQYPEAIEWFKKSADKDNKRAYLRLAKIYRAGEVVGKDDQAATLWLNKAITAYKKDADKGDSDAALALSKIYSDAELAMQDPQAAKSWLDIAISGYKKKVDQGDFSGANSLANIYRDGKLVPQDLKESFKWSLEAAELGSVTAQFSVGQEYCNGYEKDVKDLAAGIKWYTKAAEKNYVPAQEMLATIYFDNRHGVMDSKKAYEWASKVGDKAVILKGIIPSILADCYINGKGVDRNTELGIEWLRKAAAQGYPQAQAILKNVEKQLAQAAVAKEKRRKEVERLQGSPIDYITFYAKANGGGLPVGKRFRFSGCLVQGGIICLSADSRKNKLTCSTAKNFDNPETLEAFYARSEEVLCGEVTASMQYNGQIGIHRFND